MTDAPLLDPEAIDALAQALDTAGFSAARVEEATAGSGFGLASVPLVVRRMPPDDPLVPLISLFVYGAPVALGRADAVLAPLGVAGAERLGLVSVDGTGAAAEVRPAVRLAPFGDLLLASDRPDAPFREFVMGGSGSTRSLANLTVRRPVGTALDIGTGSGVQALLASAHAGQVTATDVNPRALAFARFNARLNHVANVEFVEGPWLAPVAGRRFDLVVSNPPFVVSPDSDLLFRDGPEPGDAVSRKLVAAVPDHLADGGIAQLLVSWVHDPKASWSDPIRAWVADCGCDTWLLHAGSQSPEAYAVEWNQHLARDPAAHAVALQRWLGWFDREHIEAVAYGLVLLRLQSGAAWFRADEIPDIPAEPAGEQLAAAIEAHDVLRGLAGGTALLDARPVTSPRHRLEQVLAPVAGRYEVEAARIRLDEPLGFTADVDAFAATLLTLLDGTRTLRDAITVAAPVLDATPSDLEQRAASLVASMVAMGLVRLT